MSATVTPGSKAQGVGGRLAEVARRHSGFPALVLADTVIDYRQFWVISRAFARRMQALGVDANGIVALNTTNPLVSVAVLMASALIGCQFVIAGRNLAKTKALRPTHFLRTEEMAEGSRIPYHLIDEAWWPGPNEEADFGLDGFGPIDLDAPWLAQHTSGTTGTPKYLALSQRIVLDRTAAIAADFPQASTTLAMLFGCTSRPYHARVIGALLNACTIVAGNDLDQWRRWGVDYVCASPLQAADFFRNVETNRKFKRIETSGGRLSDPDALVLLEHFQTVIDIYGATETNKSFSTLITQGADGLVHRVGKPLDSEIEIIGPSGQPVAPGESGLVRVRNPYLAPGYLGEPEKTAVSFRDGWFHPGDIAAWTPDGALDIIGREDDLMSIGGVKVYAGLIDLMMKLVPGVQDAICVKNPKAGAGDQLTAFVRFDPLVNHDDCRDAIRDAIKDKFGMLLPIGNIHVIDKIPRDENGKPQRAALQKLILDKSAGGRTKRATPDGGGNVAT